MQVLLVTLITGLLSLASVVTAHPGEKYSAEDFAKKIVNRDLVASTSKEVVKSCGAHPKQLALRERAATRRSLTAQLLREERNIVDSK
jgi:hypothetical protein